MTMSAEQSVSPVAVALGPVGGDNSLVCDEGRWTPLPGVPMERRHSVPNTSETANPVLTLEPPVFYN